MNSGLFRSFFYLVRQHDSERSIWLLLESAASAINDPCLSQNFGFYGYVVLNASLYPAKHLANSSAFIHMPTLLSARNRLATGLAILAVPIPAIPFKAQALFVFRVLDRAHALLLFSSCG